MNLNHDDDTGGDVLLVAALAVFHGAFWLGVGLAFGRLLWGAP